MFFYRKLSADSKWIALIVFLACVPHIVTYVESYFEIKKETPVRYVFFNIYMIQELLFLAIFFNQFFPSGVKKTIFRTSVVLCFLLGVMLIIKNGFTNFQTIWLCFNNIAYTMWSLLLLYKLYERDDTVFNTSYSLLFYIFGLFFYTSCTILVFGLWDYIRSHENSYLKNLNAIHSIYNVVMYVSFSIGFIIEVKLFRPKKS
ncbi:hypothetical protein IWQ47_001180 [Aquimarina sp. EL_43]|nr:hypothetical protein [Aquimarina sp. EL_35]MBG6150582.1 hypothetical protein [Aquimarina sp. EL_32]MBG6168110.1 hypothetical protein [Aquimarina sp. EL_43]